MRNLPISRQTMTILPRSLCLLLTLHCFAWSSVASAVEPYPPLPNCPTKMAPTARAQTLDRYVTALEHWADKTPDFMARSEVSTNITLVAAHLLPEATPFRRYEQECWVFFEDARRALADGKTRSATQSVRAWDTCLAMRQDGLHAAAKPFMRCLR